MTDQEKKLYELALRIGERRFGSPCSHATIHHGRCVNCLRRVLSK